MASRPGRTPEAWDPASYVWGPPLELYRCCLLRNLYSYPGLPADEGGGIARPDLATDYPDVSDDGLVWTIHLKDGIHYAPPYQELTVTSRDVVAGFEHLVAFEREAPPEMVGLSAYYSVIEGFDAYVAGDAGSIPGLETPDDLTLVIRLTEPAGDLVDRLALPNAAPIPSGAAEDHTTDYVRYLAALGPYMFEGSDDLDPSLPPGTQPVTGWTPRGAELVRNPMWDPGTDPLRTGYVDRIEFLVTQPASTAPALRRRDARLRRAFLEGKTYALSATSENRRLVAEGTLPGRVVTDRTALLQYMEMNVAVPPFDDVHVRRAVNLILDRTAIAGDTGELGALVRPTWQPLPAAMARFRVPDGWQPSWAAGVPMTGDRAAARSEMARSRYDPDGDGRCDGPSCRARAIAYTSGDFQSSRRIGRALRSLGIVLDVHRDPEPILVGAVPPRDRIGVFFQVMWLADYGNASTFFAPLLYGPSIQEEGNLAGSLLGARPQDLARWGYTVSSVPSIDDRIERCLAMIGEAQHECWTELDLYVAEEVVPWAPLMEYEDARIISNDVVAYSFDAGLAWYPAYDRIALAPGSP
jgi:peptide/nickel transport system substrate-binding protein